MSSVELSDLYQEASRLRQTIRGLLDSGDARCQELANALIDEPGEILSVALIGQYNAGKSSIVKALAPNADVVIDANVATDRVVETVWHGLRVIDTPGVRAGRPRHDELTERAIASADLLIFVVTAELFDATIAEYFRSVVLEVGRGGECLLVVNKSTQDAGDRDTKQQALSEVLHPLTLDDVRVVFTDARSRLWAADADGEDREEYLRISNFIELIGEIDNFARRSGLRSRLTTPVYQAIDVVDRALEQLADDGEATTRLNLLSHQRHLVLRHRDELDELARASISEARSDLAKIGQEVAAEVHHEDDDQRLRLRLEAGAEEAERRCDALYDRLDTLVRASARGISDDLAGHVRLEALDPTSGRQAPAAGPLPADLPHLAGARDDPTQVSSELSVGLKKIASFFGDNARPGQPGHSFVYRTGKALGVKFKPWGAVKTAQRLGRVADGVGSVLVVMEIVNEHRRAVVERQEADRLREARQAVAGHFTGYADAASLAAEEALTSYVEGSYNAALATLDSLTLQLVEQRAGADSLSQALISHREELAALLNRIHAVELVAEALPSD